MDNALTWDMPPERNIFLSHYGVRSLGGWRGYRRGQLTDVLFDAKLAATPDYWRLRREAARHRRRRIHIAAVEVPARRDDLHRLLGRLAASRHHVTTSVAPMATRGKFDNLNIALEGVDTASLDWLVLTDDDIAVPRHFLDVFICACDTAGLSVAMPAHRFHSHAAWMLTQRHWDSLVRTTRFVECGPLTAIRADMLPLVLPFPVTRWAWGLDVLWSETARRHGLPIGIVDATPIEHLRPVSTSYDSEAAGAEALALLGRNGIVPDNREYLRTLESFRTLPRPLSA